MTTVDVMLLRRCILCDVPTGGAVICKETLKDAISQSVNGLLKVHVCQVIGSYWDICVTAKS